MTHDQAVRTLKGSGRFGASGPRAELSPDAISSLSLNPGVSASLGQRRRVVLVHGVRTSATMWRAQCELLTDAGFAPVAVDLPGHGARQGEKFTLASARAALGAAVDGDRRAVVVGLSLGGYVSMNWAARTSVPPAALILSSCTALPGGPFHQAFLHFSRLMGRRPSVGERFSDFAARVVLGEQGARDVADGGVSVAGQIQALEAMQRATPLADLVRISEAGVPVTFITGRFDHFRLDERAFLAAAASPPVRKIPTANHLVSLHRPQEYGQALIGLLNALA